MTQKNVVAQKWHDNGCTIQFQKSECGSPMARLLIFFLFDLYSEQENNLENLSELSLVGKISADIYFAVLERF